MRARIAAALAAGLLTAAVWPAWAAGAARAPAKKKAEGPPPPDVKLVIEAPTPHGAWRMRVTNEGDVPVMLTADARLLSLDVTPRGARKPEHCELPAEMRPSDDLGRPLVLPPKRTFAERFEPRLYCLDGKRLDALAPGSIVVATLGFAGGAGHPPYVLAPIEGLEEKASPVKSLRSEPIGLPDDPEPGEAPRDTPPGTPVRPDATFTLRTPRAIDAGHAEDIAIPVTLTNNGHRAAIVRFRPETLGFEVVGPTESVHCAWASLPSAPTRELFTTLAAGGAATGLTVLLNAYCPTGTFAAPGLYVVRATLDTRHASGADIGLRTFDGLVIASAPTVVRLRHGTQPEPAVRPTLAAQ